MTRSDIIAAMHLGAFAQGDGPPIPRGVTEEAFLDAAVALREGMIDDLGGNMPFRLTLANTLWTGLVANWPHFTEEERAQARRYFQGGEGTLALTLPVFAAMYGSAPEEAQSVFYDERFEEQLASLHRITIKSALHSAKMTEIALWWPIPR